MVVGVVAALLAAGAALYVFAPRPEQQRAEAAPEGRVLASGEFRDGDAFHSVRGTVRVVEVEGRHVLRFEGYDATSGPDVYVYLTRAPRASSVEEVEGGGVLVRAPTPTGQATLRGDFNLDVPEGVAIGDYAGVAIWCERFDVLFGYAQIA